MSKALHIVVVLGLVMIMLIGCTAQKPQIPSPPTYTPTPVEPQSDVQTQPPEPVAESIKDYIPLKAGNKWVYEGEGSDFASYTQEVTHQKDGRYQLKTTAAGNTTINIYEVRDDSIANVYVAQGADGDKNILSRADIADIVLLKLPIAVGTSWVSEQNSYEIIQTDARVTVPAGTYDNCVVVRLTFAEGSTTLLYYKRGVGLVLSEFSNNQDSIVSRLKSFESK
jgi:hypothetical protein